MEIDYDTLTAEGLEEHVEFIDWSMVPSHLITNEVKRSFKTLKGIKARIWFEDLLTKMVIKEDKKIFSEYIFFFIEDEYYMSFNTEKNIIRCSKEYVWSKIAAELDEEYIYTNNFIRNIFRQKFKFKKIEVLPINNMLGDFSIQVESYFKTIEKSPLSFQNVLTLSKFKYI